MNTLITLIMLLGHGNFQDTSKLQCDIKAASETIGEAATNKALTTLDHETWERVNKILDETWDMDACD